MQIASSLNVIPLLTTNEGRWRPFYFVWGPRGGGRLILQVNDDLAKGNMPVLPYV